MATESLMSKYRLVYWSATGIIAAECLIGGFYDLLRLSPFFPMLAQLGYPAYLATLLGLAKIAGGVVIGAPRLPRLKEWAYAGVMINMLGATASWICIHHGFSDFLPPLGFAVLTLVSWATRPEERKLPS